MKSVHILIITSLMTGLNSMGAITHTLVNKSDHPIYGWFVYRGESTLLSSCRRDEGVIQPGQSLTSKAGWCVLDFVQIQDDRNPIIPGPPRVVKIEVGTTRPFSLESFFDAPVVKLNDGTLGGFVIHGNTQWQYDNEGLKPISGVVFFKV
jgi:hypothetical protein